MPTVSKLLLAVLLAMLAMPASARFYCCKDARGQQVCGNPLPDACEVQPYSQYDSKGLRTRTIDRPLTPEEIAQKKREEEQRLADKKQREEQVRRDQALLASYASEDDILRARDRATQDVREALQKAQQLVDLTITRLDKNKAKAGARPSEQLPPALRDAINDDEAELKAQATLIEAKRKELDDLYGRFEEDRLRYRTLRQQKQVTPPY